MLLDLRSLWDIEADTPYPGVNEFNVWLNGAPFADVKDNLDFLHWIDGAPVLVMQVLPIRRRVTIF